jgi:hypothetical protein
LAKALASPPPAVCFFCFPRLGLSALLLVTVTTFTLSVWGAWQSM